MRSLVDGVVRGIGDYGNCVGIPTVGGETGFHRCYNGNILVNAFALGVARRERIFRAKASGVGNPILYAGSRTGRDGIHGATMASDAFDAESEKKRPTVQVGDPFTEKVLLEACLEAMRTGAIVAIQDMGAAGLTSSTFEMAARGGVGFRLDLDRVPLREPGLTPYEMMLSESQERMVMVARRGTRGGGRARLPQVGARGGDDRRGDRRPAAPRSATAARSVADMPIAPLTDEAPVYQRPVAEPRRPRDAARRRPRCRRADGSARRRLRALLATPELGSKEWIWRQYDHTVRTNTVQRAGRRRRGAAAQGDADRASRSTSDVNPVYCWLDPRARRHGRRWPRRCATWPASAPSRSGSPTASTSATPRTPRSSWQFREAVRGMAEACRALGVPVVSGNVSLYNETEGRSIHPTPTVGDGRA